MQFDVNINATLEIADNEWKNLLEVFDGDEEAALEDLAADLEGSNLDSIYGEAWVCSVNLPTPM